MLFVLLLGIANAQAGAFRYENLVELIQKNSITSIESLLPLLPEELRSNYTLMRMSGSLQDATAIEPRAILFGSDASLTCAFNGGSAALAGSDSLECFQFRTEEKRFDFRQIQFPTAQNTLKKVRYSASGKSADGKISCAGCHGGTDARPNWSEYSKWPGAYGTDDDFIPGTADPSEREDYDRFVASRPSHLRYRWLIQSEAGGPNSPFNRDAGTRFRPNLRFSDLLGRLNALRAGEKLRARTASWQAMAFALNVFRCDLSVDQKKSLLATGRPFESEMSLDSIFASIGETPRSWTLRARTEAVRKGTSPFQYQSGYGYLLEGVAMTVIQARAQAGDPRFQSLVKEVRENLSPESDSYSFLHALNETSPNILGPADLANWTNACVVLSAEFTKEYLTPQADSKASSSRVSSYDADRVFSPSGGKGEDSR